MSVRSHGDHLFLRRLCLPDTYLHMMYILCIVYIVIYGVVNASIKKASINIYFNSVFSGVKSTVSASLETLDSHHRSWVSSARILLLIVSVWRTIPLPGRAGNFITT